MDRNILKYDTTFWLEFLQLMKSKPVLWKMDSEIYKDKALKDKALKKMVIKMKEINPEAGVETVRRKIDSFRTILRRELKKMQIRHDAGHTFRESTWIYFDYTLFLMRPNDPLYVNYLQYAEKYEENVEDDDKDEEPEYEVKYKRNSLAPSLSLPLSKIKRHRSPSPKPCSRYECLETVFEAPSSNHTQDEADILGLSVTMQYRSLPKKQQIFAKKAIDDILFEAKLETLHRNSVQINEEVNFDSLCSNCAAEL